jgi:hypothetical protein
MKKAILLVATTAIMFLWPTNPSVARHQQVNSSPAVFFNYTWYLDYDMEYPVGTVSTVNTEMIRLRNVHPGYVFSSTFSLGLREFEYGYYSYYAPAVIYTDMPW